jgi:hypothetical protein
MIREPDDHAAWEICSATTEHCRAQYVRKGIPTIDTANMALRSPGPRDATIVMAAQDGREGQQDINKTQIRVHPTPEIQ